MNSLPSLKELDAAYEKVEDAHTKYLARFGVKLPKRRTYKGIWLAMLMHYSGGEVHKDHISDAVRREFPNAARDQQVRHLKRDGWNLQGEGGTHQLDFYRPSSTYQNDVVRRTSLDRGDFEEIKRAFSSCCATCGAREGMLDVRYTSEPVKLQRGHMDPHKPGNDPGNVIPQCQFCNRAYRSDFTFDSKGRVRAIADLGPVKRASMAVRRKVLDWLRKDFAGRK